MITRAQIGIQLGFLTTQLLDGRLRLFLEAYLFAVDVIEAACDLACELDVRHLVFAHGYLGGTVDEDVGALQQRVTQETVGRQIFPRQLLLLVFVGRHTFQPTQRRDHRQQQVQLSMFGHFGLDEECGMRRIDPCCQPVDDHVPHGLLDDLRIVVMRGQRVPVGHEEQALELVLHLHPVLQYTMVMPQVQTACGTHPG